MVNIMTNTENNIKKFEGFLDKMRGLLDSARKQGHIIIRVEDLENAFPELKESNDERIRNALIDLIKSKEEDGYMVINNFSTGSILAWLEKQDKQTSTLPKWKYKKDHTPLLRDSIILNKYGGVAKSPSGAMVSDVWVLDYAELAKLPKEEHGKQGEPKPIIEMKSAEESLGISSKEYNKIVNECLYGEQKSAEWSEEDEHRLKDIIYFLDTAKKHYASTVELDACIDWLKSLKQRIGG